MKSAANQGYLTETGSEEERQKKESKEKPDKRIEAMTEKAGRKSGDKHEREKTEGKLSSSEIMIVHLTISYLWCFTRSYIKQAASPSLPFLLSV